ncbi:DddA-like double-stranded DNA deaminase toxin [Actinocatenispora comari]|uniref:Nucleic acid/nucleotide deaminase of polymorphic system toxin n=1 Tax=Actinocatenispora comari TaxID=2807577 RepID=A0A8J4AIW0_9ACTN|nr:DddA-like double-stranded DNA deaminase toxin [Actinocatenispora comari]GIL32039.1 hypothetical protein NUM_72930 [Actinocatenispora comari]
MTSVEQVAAAIRAALAELADADRLLGPVGDRYEHAVGLLAAVTDGTGSADASIALAALADARQRLDDARAAMAAATRGIEQYLGDIGAGTGSSGQTDSVPAAQSSVGQLPPPAPGPDDPLPGYVQQAAGQLPQRADGDKTTGLAYDTAGRPLSTGPIVSGRSGPGRGAPYLRRDDPAIRWHLMQAVVEHVEGHMAALMRQPGAPREVVLVINNVPCRGPRGCRTLLPGVIPARTRLTVFVTDHGQTRYYATYVGHGRGIAS